MASIEFLVTNPRWMHFNGIGSEFVGKLWVHLNELKVIFNFLAIRIAENELEGWKAIVGHDTAY
jgi:hypothetical protein